MASRRWLVVAVFGLAVLGVGLTALIPDEPDSAAPEPTPTPGATPTSESSATATPTRAADAPTDTPTATGEPNAKPPSTPQSTTRPERSGGEESESGPTVESEVDGNVSGGATNDGTLRTYRSQAW